MTESASFDAEDQGPGAASGEGESDPNIEDLLDKLRDASRRGGMKAIMVVGILADGSSVSNFAAPSGLSLQLLGLSSIAVQRMMSSFVVVPAPTGPPN